MAPTATQPGHLGSVDASSYLLDLKDISSIKEKPSVDLVEEKLISGGNSSAQCTVEDSDETLLIKPDLVEEVSTLQKNLHLATMKLVARRRLAIILYNFYF